MNKRGWGDSPPSDLVKDPVLDIATLAAYPGFTPDRPLWQYGTTAGYPTSPVLELEGLGQASISWALAAPLAEPQATSDLAERTTYARISRQWAGASLVMPEPAHAVYDAVSGKTYQPEAMKDLLAYGVRVRGYSVPANAGTLHVALINGLAIKPSKTALLVQIGDAKAAEFATESQQVLGYDTTVTEVDGEAANACLTGNFDLPGYATNSEADQLFIAKTTLQLRRMSGAAETATYSYVLEVADGKIIGGEYCADGPTQKPTYLRGITSIGFSDWSLWKLYVASVTTVP